MHRPLPDFEPESEPSFTKLIIEIFDPVSEPIRSKVPQVTNNDLAHEIADDLALVLRVGMHRTDANAHAHALSKIDAGLTSLVSRAAFRIFCPSTRKSSTLSELKQRA